jgi:hypothetical protein
LPMSCDWEEMWLPSPTISHAHCFMVAKATFHSAFSIIGHPWEAVWFWCPLGRQSKIVRSSRGNFLSLHGMWKMELRRKWNRQGEQWCRNLNVIFPGVIQQEDIQPRAGSTGPAPILPPHLFHCDSCHFHSTWESWGHYMPQYIIQATVPLY